MKKYVPIDWNTIQDETDKIVWDRMTANFWLPEKIPLSNDIPSWERMDKGMQNLVMQVFAGLTLLDTLQSNTGAVSLMSDAHTQHEEACYTFIASMESIHAKSYSSIFMTLADTKRINDIFQWAENDPNLQYKARRIDEWYHSGDSLKKKAASVMLESFLFYSGFYLPLYLGARGQIPNSADIISLILRDEGIHGFYIGHKFQQEVERMGLSEMDKAELHSEILEFFYDLYENELQYTQKLYDNFGLTEDVKSFLRYNANKTFQNLGLPSVFDASETQVSEEILASLNADQSSTHDFFSSSGSSYSMGTVEATDDEDWEF